VPPERVEGAHRRVLLGKADMDVECRLGRPPEKATHLVGHDCVAAALDELGGAERRRRVQPAADECGPRSGGGPAKAGEGRDGVAHRHRGRRAELELRGVRVVPRGALLDVHRGEHRFGNRNQVVRVRVDEEELLLDPQRERGAEGEAAHRPSSADSAAMRPRTSAEASPLA
jgi:hypothetical protein